MSKEKMMEKAYNEVERLIPAESDSVREQVIENSMACNLKNVAREEIHQYVKKHMAQEDAAVMDYNYQDWSMTR